MSFNRLTIHSTLEQRIDTFQHPVLHLTLYFTLISTINLTLNMDGYLSSRATLEPDDIAIEDGHRTISYHELDTEVGKLASVLMGFHLSPEDPVCVLESIGSNSRSGHLPAKYDERHTVTERVLHWGHDIRGARTGSNKNDARLARYASIPLGHMTGTLLMTRKNELEVF